MHNTPDSAAAAAAVRALQQSQIATLQTQPSTPYLAMPSLPLCNPRIPMPEPQQHAFSHAGDDYAHYQDYHQQLATAPAFGPSRPMMDEVDGSWRAVAEHQEEQIPGGVGSAPMMQRRQAQTPAAQARLRSNGKAALSIFPTGCQIWNSCHIGILPTWQSSTKDLCSLAEDHANKCALLHIR